MIMMRGLVVGLILATTVLIPGCGGSGPEQGPVKFDRQDRAEVKQLQSTPPMQHGEWGTLAVGLDGGNTLLSENSQRPFTAASTTKTFTIGAMLGLLGPDYRFRTPVVRLGAIDGQGRLDGDLVLRASGDLTMGSRAESRDVVAYTGFDHTDANEIPGFAELTPQDPLAGLDKLAQQVAKSGVSRVSGDVVIDDRLWQAKRIGTDLVTPIVINDNAIDITLTPTEVGQPVDTGLRPETAAYDIDVKVKTGPPDSAITVDVSKPKGRKVTVTGRVPADADPVVQVFRSPDPSYLARVLFVEALDRAGVKVDAPVIARNASGRLPSFERVADQPQLAKLVSPPVSEFGKLIMKVSHNLGANMVPYWLAVQVGQSKFEVGMKRIRSFARRAGVKPGQAILVDGQGLPGNRISPLAQVTLLRYMAEQPYGELFADSMPVKGVDGVPGDPESDPGTGHVVAKNGLLGGLNQQGEMEVLAMALAGYAGEGDRRVAFDVVVNHVPILPNGKSSEDPAALNKAFTRFDPLEQITTRFYLAGTR